MTGWLAMVGVAATLAGGAHTKDAPKPGDYAPAFLLKTLNPDASGLKVFSTKAHVGSRAKAPKKAMLLNFAASYCEPCKRELPELAKLMAGYAPQDVVFAVVVIDKDQPGQDAMRKLGQQLGLKMPLLADRMAIVGRRYGAQTLPLSVVVKGDGRIAWRRSGYKPETVQALREALDKLVAP